MLSVERNLGSASKLGMRAASRKNASFVFGVYIVCKNEVGNRAYEKDNKKFL